MLLTREEARQIKIVVARGKNPTISLASRSILTWEVRSTVAVLITRCDDRDLADSTNSLSTSLRIEAS